MKNFLEKLNKAKTLVHLEPEMKKKSRAQFAHLISHDAIVRAATDARQSMRRSPLTLIFTKPMPIILAIALLFSGGVSFAAQNALPGDVLYPVKVSINEELQSAFAGSAQAKAEFEAQRAQRRLDEAAELKAEGKFTTEAEAETEANFQKHADKTRELIADLETKGNTKAAATVTAEFEAALRRNLAVDEDVEVSASARVNANTNAAENESEKTAPAAKVADREHGVVQELRAQVSDEADKLAEIKTNIEAKETEELNNDNDIKANPETKTETSTESQDNTESNNGDVEVRHGGQLKIRTPEIELNGSDSGEVKLGF